MKCYRSSIRKIQIGVSLVVEVLSPEGGRQDACTDGGREQQHAPKQHIAAVAGLGRGRFTVGIGVDKAHFIYRIHAFPDIAIAVVGFLHLSGINGQLHLIPAVIVIGSDHPHRIGICPVCCRACYLTDEEAL